MADTDSQIRGQASVPPAPLLEMRGITKVFPGVKALDNVSFDVYPGEVHALVGENGAGKSTLMKILVGAYKADEGTLTLDGKVTAFGHPREAQTHGLSIIYQEFNLLPDRTVAQNIFVGREPTRRFGFIDDAQMRQDTIALLRRLNVHENIGPDVLVRDLSVAQQQIVEIAKALSFKAQVLVMDEPTASLALSEVELLFEIVRKLQADGIAVVYISHRLQEVFTLADRITVLKDGVVVGTVGTDEVTTADIVRMMVGRDFDHYYPPHADPADIGRTLLQVKHGTNQHLHDINFELKAGEVLGIAGLQGSGRTELAQALFGVVPFTGGTVQIGDDTFTPHSPADAIRHQMGYVTEDRKGEGLLLDQSVSDNMLLVYRALRGLLSRVGGQDGSLDLMQQLAEKVDVRSAGYTQTIGSLSGGNQQKAILGKWLAISANILILDEPTRGIDVNAKAGIYDLLRELARAGAAILMISSELPEVIGLSDRILVMRDGTIAGELPADSDEPTIMMMATGETTVGVAS